MVAGHGDRRQQLWQARSYVAFDWVNEAESLLGRVKEEQLTTKKLKELRDLVAADVFVRRRDYAAAIPYLQRAVGSASGSAEGQAEFSAWPVSGVGRARGGSLQGFC